MHLHQERIARLFGGDIQHPRATTVPGRLVVPPEQPHYCETIDTLPHPLWDGNDREQQVKRMGSLFDGTLMKMPSLALPELCAAFNARFSQDAYQTLSYFGSLPRDVAVVPRRLLVMRECLPGTASCPYNHQTDIRRGELHRDMRPLTAHEAVGAMLVYWHVNEWPLFQTLGSSLHSHITHTSTSSALPDGRGICLGWNGDMQIDVLLLPRHMGHTSVGLALGMAAE